MITTLTIERLCCQLDSQCHNDVLRAQRLQYLEDCGDDGAYEQRDKSFAWIGTERTDPYDRGQLACEAMKWLRLRLAGLDFHAALDRMVGASAA